jgi:hypothetical protein
MKVAKPMLRLVCLLLIGTFASCVRSENPLSDEKTSTLDKRLLGRWREVGEEGGSVMRVEGVKGSKHRLQAIDEKDDAGSSTELLTTTLGGQHFMSLGITDKAGKKGYFICRYEMVDDDTLKVIGQSSGGSTALKQLIEMKKLKGMIVEEKYGDTVVKEPMLAESTDSLRRFLEKNWRDIFSEAKTNVQIYKRQK